MGTGNKPLKAIENEINDRGDDSQLGDHPQDKLVPQ
jgi:hypothetical protein